MGKQRSARETLSAMHSHLFACVNEQAAEIAEDAYSTDGGLLRAKERYTELCAEYQALIAAIKAIDDNASVAAERDQLRAEVDRLRGELDNAYQDTDYYVQSAEDYGRQLTAATARAEAAESLLARTQADVISLRGMVERGAAEREQITAHAADLRRALELWKSHVSMPTGPTADYGAILASLAVAKMETDAALALTPAQSLAALEARVLREAADTVPVGGDAHDWIYYLAAKAEAASREEAANE